MSVSRFSLSLKLARKRIDHFGNSNLQSVQRFSTSKLIPNLNKLTSDNIQMFSLTLLCYLLSHFGFQINASGSFCFQVLLHINKILFS